MAKSSPHMIHGCVASSEQPVIVGFLRCIQEKQGLSFLARGVTLDITKMARTRNRRSNMKMSGDPEQWGFVQCSVHFAGTRTRGDPA
jgi:hypothetical protein